MGEPKITPVKVSIPNELPIGTPYSKCPTWEKSNTEFKGCLYQSRLCHDGSRECMNSKLRDGVLEIMSLEGEPSTKCIKYLAFPIIRKMNREDF